MPASRRFSTLAVLAILVYLPRVFDSAALSPNFIYGQNEGGAFSARPALAGYLAFLAFLGGSAGFSGSVQAGRLCSRA